MFTSHGVLKYDDEEHRLVLKVDQELANYYLRSIPRAWRVIRPGWAAHITVVRPEFDEVHNIQYWGLHEGKKVEFIYDPILERGQGFFWLLVWSKGLEEVRSELGLLNVSKYPKIPDGYKKTFHCSVGRYTELIGDGELPER